MKSGFPWPAIYVAIGLFLGAVIFMAAHDRWGGMWMTTALIVFVSVVYFLRRSS